MGKFVRKSEMKEKVGWPYLLSVRLSADSSGIFTLSLSPGISKDVDWGNNWFVLRETVAQAGLLFNNTEELAELLAPL